jgi:hypothetical protein
VNTAYTTHAVTAADGTSEKHCPKWAFDKKLAHPTQGRGTSSNYDPFIDVVLPRLRR